MAERDGTDQPASKGKDEPVTPVPAAADSTPKDVKPAGDQPVTPAAPASVDAAAETPAEPPKAAASSFTNTALANSVGVTPAAAPPPSADVKLDGAAPVAPAADQPPAPAEAAAPAAPVAPAADQPPAPAEAAAPAAPVAPAADQPPAPTEAAAPAADQPPAPATPPAAAADGAAQEDKPKAVTPPAGPVAEGEEAGKDKPAGPTQPTMDEEDTPEAREKRKQAEAAANAAANQGQGQAKPAMDAPKNEDTAAPAAPQQPQGKGIQAYQTAFRKNGFIDFMNNEWGTPDVDDEMKKAIGEKGKISKNKKYGLDFVLNNGQKIEWHQNLGGSEFIGMTTRTKDFDLTTAHAVIATSKSRGWKTVHVHGDKDQKDMLWLEAMRQGLEVANHQPTMDSKYRAMWEKEAQERLDANLMGVSPAEHQLPRIPKDGVKFDGPDEMQPPAQTGDAAKPSTPEAAKPGEGPKDAAPADGGKPATPEAAAPASAAESSFMKPAEDAPSSNFAEFLARQRKAYEGDPEKLKSIQSLEDSASGKAGPTTIDPEIASAAAKEGITLPVKADASAQPAPVAADEGAKVVDPKATAITPPAAPVADTAGKPEVVDPKATAIVPAAGKKPPLAAPKMK